MTKPPSPGFHFVMPSPAGRWWIWLFFFWSFGSLGWADDVLWAGRWTVFADGSSQATETPRELLFLRNQAATLLSSENMAVEWKRGRLQLDRDRKFSWEGTDSFRWEISPLGREASFYEVRARLWTGKDLRLDAELQLARDQPFLIPVDQALYFLFLR